MDTGWISVYRTLQEHWLWQEKPFDKARAWIDLLLLVNHKENKIMFDGTLTTVSRGSKITSLRQLSDRWGWSTKKTKKFLSDLESDGMITYLSDKKKTVITIVKYDIYQIQGNSEETVKKHKGNSQETTKKTNNNVNNDNNVNKNIYSHLETDKSEIRKLYPGNKNKSVADKKLPKLIEKYGKEQLIRCIERYNQYVQDTRANGFATLQYKNEGTFWNGGYIDYLDENVSQETVSQSKEEVEYDNTRFTPEQLEAYYRTDPEDEDLPF
ncbi:hypothetical protein [Zhenhengia yiwuensis]|uniref:Uncharacterized protein n=1 Tax=Zhenhengia yiwuensis TaxID=2763666 RepID=A0A926IFJ3_9FIRM|nr:hypothetical protein [Zhenhengia yiwuensis]MBC8580943.1 hypothetical protein [Zhenhengia yiwuensis]MBS5799094.1 hypothetical protein [Clostridiales bacterium]